MEPEVNITPDKRSTSSEYYRRLKSSRNSMPCLVNMDDTTELKKQKTSINVLHYSSPSAISPLLDHSEDKKFGSVTKEIQALRAQRMQVMSPYFAKYPSLLDRFDEVGMINKEETGRLENQRVTGLANQGVITNDPEEEHITNDVPVIVLSSEEDDRDEKPSGPFQEAVLKQSVEQLPMRDTVEYCRRIKSSRNSMPCLVNMDDTTELQKQKTSINVLHYSSPSAISPLLDHSDDKKFGSVTKEIQVLLALRMQVLSPYFAKYPSLLDRFGEVGMINKEETGKLENHRVTGLANQGVITNDLEEEDITNDVPAAASLPDVIILSNEEDDSDEKPSVPFQEAVLKHFVEQLPMRDTVEYHDRNASKAEFEAPKSEPSPAGKDITSKDKSVYVGVEGQHCYEEYHVPIAYHEECETPKSEGSSAGKDNTSRDKGVYVGVQEEDKHEVNTEDGLEDIWREMSMAIECSKDVAVDPPPDEEVNKGGEYCDHSFILKDDLGYVCRVCGIIDRGIETIFEFQYKIKRSTRTYMPDTWNSKDRAVREVSGLKFVEDCVVVNGISAHPRHMNQMKPHQVEGFNFLVSNLAGENPGGCILAHAPGSGKTFMIISFMQSFLAKYPNARPLVVLPKGILATWKKEFKTWQVEDLPLLDFYSAKADNRSQQLEVLQKWVEQKSILFLGYKQLSAIVCDCETSSNNDTSSKCQEILLKVPSILILDEGHTARNEDTNVLQSLAKVKTPRKVVLSGTLYQNHVAEVFNILNLVRPRFLRLETSRPFVKRIMSRVNIQGVRKQLKASGHGAFYDLVENTLQQETDFKSKVAVIQDLREMTSKVLHFYKGDFLDELPGLVDFSVLLNLSSRQKHETEKLKKIASKFKMSSIGSAVYLHPSLKALSEKCTDISSVTDCMVDEMLEGLVVKDGVKAKFFLNMLNLCESSGEKLLVFSQYLLPLKFLERLAVKKRGWSPGNEIFVISGESSPEQREWSMERFNNSPDAKVFFGSIKACGEGISLVGASRIIVLDVHLNPSVTRQAIGRAFRPGQVKRVFAYRLVAADSPEAEDHSTCFKKELISRMWFEWNEYCGYQNFEFKTVDVKKCGDVFLESPILGEDVKVLYER